jgi:hypothetical protein
MRKKLWEHRVCVKMALACKECHDTSEPFEENNGIEFEHIVTTVVLDGNASSCKIRE